MLILPIKSKWFNMILSGDKVDHSLPPYVRWILRQVRKNGEQNPEQNTTRYTYTKSEKGKIVKCSRQYLRHIALMS